MVEKVGSDISSATNGSSVVSVAGKNRFPAKPCAQVVSEDMARAATAKIIFRRFSFISFSSRRGTAIRKVRHIRKVLLTNEAAYSCGLHISRCGRIMKEKLEERAAAE